MIDVIQKVNDWLAEEMGIAIAIVVKTWGSSPRQAGAWMVINESGDFDGSVSGGCVESAVIEEALQSIRAQLPKMLHFGVADESAWEVGLACGGEIDIFINPLDGKDSQTRKHFREIVTSVGGDEQYSMAHLIRGSEDRLGGYWFSSASVGCIGTMGEELQSFVELQSRDDGASSKLTTEIYKVGEDGEELFIEFHPPVLKLIIVGGVHIAIPLAHQAKLLGYRVHVIDPRGAFGKDTRFPHVDGLFTSWPDKALDEIGLDSGSAVAVLTHDPKIDDPALSKALSSSAFYVGALGSKRTQKNRRRRLLESGLAREQMARLYGPIGLDLGGRSPEEIALSIMAEIVAARSGKNARFGRDPG